MKQTKEQTVVVFAGAMRPEVAIPFPKASQAEVRLWLLKQKTAAIRAQKGQK